MEFKDYYDILGVQEDADKKAIKTAYRRLARKYHPDVSKERDSERRFKEVSEAYEVLGNDERRAEYDQLRKYRGKGGEFEPPPGWQGAGGGAQYGEFDFSDFFASAFGDHFRQSTAHGRSSRGSTSSEDLFSRRGQDIEIDMPIFLEETLKDEAKTIQYQLPHYGESGRLQDVKKTLKVKIPKGAVDGELIRLQGQGAPGFGKGPAGDLYLRIKLVPHPLFDVAGHDLTITVPVAPWEAALGATVNIPTLSGRINLTVAPNSQTGQRLRVKGRGLPTKTDKGDLYVVLKVVMPKTADAASKSLWEQLAAKHAFDPRSELETNS
jgi:curved DNA-binding protein